jgi:hypothetical protein
LEQPHDPFSPPSSTSSSLFDSGHGHDGGRHLASSSSSWSLVELEELMFKALLLLCVSCACSMISTIAIG